MGKGGGSSQPQTTTAYQTNLPEYAKPYVENMLNAAQAQIYKPDMKGFNEYRPYSTNPQDYFAGPSNLQKGVYQEAAGMQTPGAYNAAQGLTGLAAMGQMGAGRDFARQATNPFAVQAYMSPYMQNVVDTQKLAALRDYQVAQPTRQAQQTLRGAFGGSRSAIENAEAQRNLMSQLQGIQAQGTQQAFQNAQAQQQFGANLGLQGLGAAAQSAGQLGTLAGAQQQADLARMGFQQQTGAAQQQYQQNIINQAIQDYATQQQYPMIQLANMSGLLRGLPLQSGTTQMYQAAPSVTSQLAGLGTAGVGAYGLGRAAGVFKKGGQVKGYKYGGLIPPEKLRAMANNLTKDQLEAQLRDPSLDEIERQIFSTELDNKTSHQGLVNAGAPVFSAAGGGIVAFGSGDLVSYDDAYEEDDDDSSVGYSDEADDNDLIDAILAAGIPAGAYGASTTGRGLPALGENPNAPTGVGIRADAKAPRGIEALTQYVLAKESGGRRFDKSGNLLTSSKGAEGEMQVMPMTQRDPGFGVKAARDDSPEEKARVGRDYLGALLNKYGDEKLAAIAYNWGPGNTDKWLKSGGDLSKLPNETKKYVAQLAKGGAIAFKNKGEVEDEEKDSDVSDYLGYGLLAPDIYRLGSQLVRGAPALPPGSLSGLGTAGARTVGSMGSAATTAGVPTVLGYGGYKLSKGAAKTLERPEAKEFRKELMKNRLLGGMSGDTSLAGAIMEMQSPEWKERNRLEQETLKDAPWYTRAYGIGQREYLAKNSLREPGVDPSVYGAPKSAMLSADEIKAEEVKQNEAKAVDAAKAVEADQAVARLAGTDSVGGKGSDNLSKLEQMLLRKEQKLARQEDIDANLALLLGGLGAAGGTSQHALENIAKGAQLGGSTYMAGAKQRAAGENAILSGRLGIEKMRGLQDIRQAQMDQNRQSNLERNLGAREKQLEQFAYNTVKNLGIVIDSEEGQKALANKLAELRANDTFLAKLYKDLGLPPIASVASKAPMTKEQLLQEKKKLGYQS